MMQSRWFARFHARPVWVDLLTLFVAALTARAAFGCLRYDKSPSPTQLEFPDERQYWFIAASLASGEGLLDDMGFRASRMPLYPAYLSLFVPAENGVLLAKGSQWFLGALAAPFIAATGFLLAGRRAGVLAGILVAFDPFLIFFSSLLLTETMAITVLCALWFFLVKILSAKAPASWDNWLCVGIASAIGVYLRESNLGLILVSIIFTVAVRKWSKSAWQGGAIALLCVAVALFPWAFRNYRVLGEWCWLTTRGGISLYDGVGPQATGASDLGPIQSSGEAAVLSETQWNQHFKQKAWIAIRNDPNRILRLAATKLSRMWNPLPNVEAYRRGYARWISAAWTLPFFLFAIIGALKWLLENGRSGWRVVLFLLLPAIYFSLLHSVYVGSVRYRLPAMPLLALLAALAFSKRRPLETSAPAPA